MRINEIFDEPNMTSATKVDLLINKQKILRHEMKEIIFKVLQPLIRNASRYGEWYIVKPQINPAVPLGKNDRNGKPIRGYLLLKARKHDKIVKLSKKVDKYENRIQQINVALQELGFTDNATD